MTMKESKGFWSRKRSRGQSIVEFALMLPILLILLSGLFEFGFIFMHYLAVLDAARNSARFSSDSLFNVGDIDKDCFTTLDFYRQTACMAVGELAEEQPSISLCLPGSPATHICDPGNWDSMDDVIISVFSVERDGPQATFDPKSRRFPDGTGEYGWSYAYDLLDYDQSDPSFRTGMHASEFSNSKVWSMRVTDMLNTGYVLVEIHYHYHQILAMPWFTQFVSDPILFNLYAVWPCVSAEPTSTPKP